MSGHKRSHWLLTKPSLQHCFQNKLILNWSWFFPFFQKRHCSVARVWWAIYKCKDQKREKKGKKPWNTFLFSFKRYSMACVMWTNNNNAACLKKTERLIFFLFFMFLLMFSTSATAVIAKCLSFDLNNTISHLERFLYQPVGSLCHHASWYNTCPRKKINNCQNWHRCNVSALGLVVWASYFWKQDSNIYSECLWL